MNRKQKWLILTLILLIISSMIFIILYTLLKNYSIQSTDTNVPSYPNDNLNYVSFPQNSNNSIPSYSSEYTEFDFILGIPSININNPNTGKVKGVIKMNSTYTLTKINDFTISIKTNRGEQMYFSAVTGEFGGGLLTYVPEYKEITNVNSIKSIYRVLFREINRIDEMNELFDNKNYYYYYTEALLAGKDCQVAEGFSCASENFSVKVNNESQVFRFYCGVTSKDQVVSCDEVFKNINISDISK